MLLKSLYRAGKWKSVNSFSYNFAITLLYLFEGKQQFKRVRVSLCLEL